MEAAGVMFSRQLLLLQLYQLRRDVSYFSYHSDTAEIFFAELEREQKR